MNSTEDILAERGKTHGPYRQQSELSQELKRVLEAYNGWHNLSDPQKESLSMITLKIARIVTGDADLQDHWDDIAGYARLVSKDLGHKMGFLRETAIAAYRNGKAPDEPDEMVAEVFPVLYGP